jgi:hypothetical protein
MAVEEERRAGTKHVSERSLSLSPSSLTKLLNERLTVRSDSLKCSNVAQLRKEQFANAKLNHQRAVWTIDLPT